MSNIFNIFKMFVNDLKSIIPFPIFEEPGTFIYFEVRGTLLPPVTIDPDRSIAETDPIDGIRSYSS